jgi:hypothetical protein
LLQKEAFPNKGGQEFLSLPFLPLLSSFDLLLLKIFTMMRRAVGLAATCRYISDALTPPPPLLQPNQQWQ